MNQDTLKIFNSNIIKWYPFEKDTTIIQIGLNECITKELEKTFKYVKTIENIEDLSTNIKYDYILIYGYENYNDIIKEVIEILDEHGKLLLIGNNQLGINNWSKYDIESKEGILTLENQKEKIKTLSHVKKELEEKNLTQINTFYAFPNYETSELIINEKYNMDISYLEKYNPNISENEIKIFNETKILKTIASNEPEMLSFFVNSYLIEISKQEIKNDINFVSFNNYRKEQYQLMTIIKDDVVEKLPANVKAESHIKNMIDIINNMNYENIKMLDYEKDGKIYSKLIKNQQTLDNVLANNFNNMEKIVEILNKQRDILLKNSVTYQECKDKLNYDIDIEILQKLNYMEKGYWDMVPKNCFYINDEFVFFDQEWEKDYLPVEFIIYRSIINSYDLVRNINIDELLEKLNILEYKELFENMDKELREEIIDKELYDAMYKKDNLKAIDNLINENKSYWQEIIRSGEYIKNLEKYLEDEKNDNTKKQEYINALEQKISELEQNVKKKKFF